MSFTNNRVIHFFPDTPMSYGHDMLAEQAKSGRVNVYNLKAGEFVAFVNTAFTALKLYGSHGVIIHWKAEDGESLYRGIVSTLPHFLSGGDIGYTREIANTIAGHYAEAIKIKRRRRSA